MNRFYLVLLFVLLATGAVAGTTSHVYWTEWDYYSLTNSRIVRADAVGAGATTVLDGFREGVGVKDLLIDSEGQKLYFANRSAGLIELCNFDGTARDTVVSGINPIGLALDIAAGKIYWTDYT